MGQANQYAKLAPLSIEVRKKRGTPLKETFEGVSSIMELSDEVNETIAGISFFHRGHWNTIKLDADFDQLTIKKRATT
jgi:hypothetical protein